MKTRLTCGFLTLSAVIPVASRGGGAGGDSAVAAPINTADGESHRNGLW